MLRQSSFSDLLGSAAVDLEIRCPIDSSQAECMDNSRRPLAGPSFRNIVYIWLLRALGDVPKDRYSFS